MLFWHLIILINPWNKEITQWEDPGYISSLKKNQASWQFFVTSLGWFSDPFKGEVSSNKGINRSLLILTYLNVVFTNPIHSSLSTQQSIIQKTQRYCWWKTYITSPLGMFQKLFKTCKKRDLYIYLPYQLVDRRIADPSTVANVGSRLLPFYVREKESLKLYGHLTWKGCR